ncbi:MAG: DNA repair protein RecN [Acutalibacteraceae bacterium]|nr:DNA repair protein RecN [Acutalibacteraceae bacterium]
MLKYLHIENIAVIEQSNIEFSDGFNVLTGETGAGKSIIIDSIYAVLGYRTSKELIRNGCDSARVSAVFSNISKECMNAFKDIGINLDDDGNIVIERTLSVNSGGVIKINGIPVSATVLKNISPLLVNIHGQHDNQALLNSDNHYLYIDKLALNDKELTDYTDEFKKFNSIRKKLKSLEMDEDEKLRHIDILKYQINELQNASLKIGELDELKQKKAVARNISKKIRTIKSVLAYLAENEENNALDCLRSALHIVNVDKDLHLDNESGKLLSCIEVLEDVVASFNSLSDTLNSDEYNIDVIEERLSILTNLSSKYGDNEERMLEYLSRAEDELKTILFNDDEIERLSEELVSSQEALIDKAKKLSITRNKAAKIFEKNVKEVLCKLNMPSVDISVENNSGRYTKNGCDEIQFLFSANAGENKKALSKIASGGELSRVMLSIKSVLAEKDDVPTLIFDEIDSGISGKTADMVGSQLRSVSKSHQVICVTHLAQIACSAKNHLLITKETKNNRTYTEVKTLDYDSRVMEIARIMGGSQITDSLINSAKEMLNKL